MLYLAIKVGSKYRIQRRDSGKGGYLHDSTGYVTFNSATNAQDIAAILQEEGETGALLHDEYWYEQQTAVQGGAGSPRFK